MGLYFRMEHRFGHLGIPGLVRILAFFKLVTWVLMLSNPAFYEALYFQLEGIYKGEVWRLASFLILPASGGSIIGIIFEVIFLLVIGDSLERAWGPFGVTLYFFASAAIGILVCLLLSIHIRYPSLANMPIYASLVMAAGCLYPDSMVRLYLMIPIKLKWIAALSGSYVLFVVYNAPDFLAHGLPMLSCLIPFLRVFLPTLIKGAQQRRQVTARRRRFERGKLPETEAFHICERCGATEVTEPDRDFRINAAGEELCSACREPS